MGTLLQAIGLLGIIGAVALLTMAASVSAEGQGAMASTMLGAAGLTGLAAFGLVAAGSVIIRLGETARNTAQTVQALQRVVSALEAQTKKLGEVQAVIAAPPPPRD